MTLLDAIETSVGNEYFDDSQDSEILLAQLKVGLNPACPSNQTQQPDSNKIVLIN